MVVEPALSWSRAMIELQRNHCENHIPSASHFMLTLSKKTRVSCNNENRLQHGHPSQFFSFKTGLALAEMLHTFANHSLVAFLNLQCLTGVLCYYY